MNEVWEELQEFPGYMISNAGEVYNMKFKAFLRSSLNSQGFHKVNLRRDGYAHTRSIASLVAETFLRKENDIFDTVIHLDGERDNCRFDNLMWRPRWFAIKYHKQFDKPNFHCADQFVILETGETFPDVKTPVLKYGLMHMDIIVGACNGTPVFPYWQTYAYTNEV